MPVYEVIAYMEVEAHTEDQAWLTVHRWNRNHATINVNAVEVVGHSGGLCDCEDCQVEEAIARESE